MAVAVRMGGAASLFQANPARPVTPLAVSIAVAFAALVGIVRAVGQRSWSVLDTSEDFVVLDDAFRTSVGASLIKPYDNAIHLVPRLLAELAVHAPAGWEVGVFSTAAALLTAGLVLVVYTASAGLLPRRLQRLLVSVPIVMLPLAQDGVLGFAGLLRWQLIYAAFWAILWVSPSRAGRIIAPLVVGLAAFSNGIGWVLVPLMVIRLVGRRDASAVAGGIALFAGTAWQLVVARGTGLAPQIGPRQPGATTITIIDVLPYDLPVRWITETMPLVIGLVAVAVIIILAVMKVTRPLWLLAAIAAAYAVTIYLASAAAVNYIGLELEVPVAMLVIVALVALTNPTGDLLVAEGAGLREVAPWLPVTGLATLLAVAWLVDMRVVEHRAAATAGYSACTEASGDRCRPLGV